MSIILFCSSATKVNTMWPMARSHQDFAIASAIAIALVPLVSVVLFTLHLNISVCDSVWSQTLTIEWVWYSQSSQQVWAKKTWEKNAPFWEKNTILAKKEHFLTLYFFLKGYFVYPFLHKISLFNIFKTINYLFFNISKTSYFTK